MLGWGPILPSCFGTPNVKPFPSLPVSKRMLNVHCYHSKLSLSSKIEKLVPRDTGYWILLARSCAAVFPRRVGCMPDCNACSLASTAPGPAANSTRTPRPPSTLVYICWPIYTLCWSQQFWNSCLTPEPCFLSPWSAAFGRRCGKGSLNC